MPDLGSPHAYHTYDEGQEELSSVNTTSKQIPDWRPIGVLVSTIRGQPSTGPVGALVASSDSSFFVVAKKSSGLLSGYSSHLIESHPLTTPFSF